MNRNLMRYCVKVAQWEIRFAQWETGKYQRVAFSVEGQCMYSGPGSFRDLVPSRGGNAHNA